MANGAVAAKGPSVRPVEDISDKMQMKRLELACERKDYVEAVKIAGTTQSVDVGKRAVDLLRIDKERRAIEEIAKETNVPGIGKYAVDNLKGPDAGETRRAYERLSQHRIEGPRFSTKHVAWSPDHSNTAACKEVREYAKGKLEEIIQHGRTVSSVLREHHDRKHGRYGY